MYLFKKVADLQAHIGTLSTQGATIGFVPTMGALHQGHVSLILEAQKKTDYSVCSIFVNPTQFDDKKDLDKYPRTTAEDIDKLTKIGTDILFLPDAEEIYPPGFDFDFRFNFGAMAQHMEGAHRPGHFDGMAQVVKRLVEIVTPDYIFMGQKDFQQQALVKFMLKEMDSKTQLVRCPIIRESDGLAMSSRNVRLNEKERKLASLISKTLFEAQKEARQFSLQEVKRRALRKLDIPEFEVDYFEIVDAVSLAQIDHFDDAQSVVACTTVRLGPIRLLDNMLLKEAF